MVTISAWGSDRGSMRSSVIVGVSFAVLMSVRLLVGWPTGHAFGLSHPGGDTWLAPGVARALIHGSFGNLYASGYDALPLWPVLLTPVVALSELLGMGWNPGRLPPAGYLLVPYACLTGVLVAHAGRTLAWELGVRKRLGLLQLCLVPIVVFPTISWGHPEDAIAIAFVLYTLRFIHAGRLDASAACLAVAICAKQWALLMTPMLALAASDRRWRYASIALGPPILLGLTVIALDPRHAWPALHAPSLYYHSKGDISGLSFGLGAKGSKLVRPVELALAPIVALGLRRYGTTALLWGAAGTMIVRPLLEPVMFSYYFAPAAGFAGGGLCGQNLRPSTPPVRPARVGHRLGAADLHEDHPLVGDSGPAVSCCAHGPLGPRGPHQG